MYRRLLFGILLFVTMLAGGLAMGCDGDVKKNTNQALKALPDDRLDLYGEALCRWANLQHQHIYVDGKEILYYIPPTGGRGKLYWEYPHGRGDDVLKENRGRLRNLLQNSNCNAEALDSFLAKVYSGSEAYVKSVTKESLAQGLSCLGKTEFREMTFSPD